MTDGLKSNVPDTETAAASTATGRLIYPTAVNLLALLILPALLAGMALSTGRLPFKLGVAGLCALILVSLLRRSQPARRPEIWGVVAAFAMSMVGDYFLSSRNGRVSYFEAGIAFFFIAHLGFLRYALVNGRLHRPALAVLLAGFGAYFGLALSPVIEVWALWVAVLSYLLVSCVGLAAAMGLAQPPPVKGPYVAGIGLLVFSDTLISFDEFLGYRGLDSWILPTYYLSHLAITASILLRADLRHPAPQNGNA